MAHTVTDYYIGKGVVSWTAAGGTIRDLGNVTEFELTPNIEKLEHFSSREGVRKKDKEVITSQSLSVRIVMENFSVENLRMVLLGGTATGDTFEIYDNSALNGQLQFVGTNDVGPKNSIYLYNVSFIPGSSINVIGDEWGSIELTGEALVADAGTLDPVDGITDVGGQFGKVVRTAAGV